MENEDPCDFLNRRFQNDASDPGSLQGSDDDGEEVSNGRVLNYVACHGSEPGIVENINDASSTLAEIFRCFICLGKVSLRFTMCSLDVALCEWQSSRVLKSGLCLYRGLQESCRGLWAKQENDSKSLRQPIEAIATIITN